MKGKAKEVKGDVDEEKLKLALKNGASAAINPMDEDAMMKVFEITGGNASVAIDFVGSEQSTAFGINLLRKGGKYIIVGLYGGELKLPLLSIVIILILLVRFSFTCLLRFYPLNPSKTLQTYLQNTPKPNILQNTPKHPKNI